MYVKQDLRTGVYMLANNKYLGKYDKDDTEMLRRFGMYT